MAGTSSTEIRCPSGPRRLLAILRQRGESPRMVDGNLIEFSCSDCKRALRSRGGPEISRVLHRFDITGELIETIEVQPDELDSVRQGDK